jgi:hypothetical protein
LLHRADIGIGSLVVTLKLLGLCHRIDQFASRPIGARAR